ncbi:MAG: DUF1127 domain-containing protein [Shimia sp.]|uniref:DUF1127 domain-containing protein n=1 Tax=Shimia sp. TaxID=1954381 RepID=UPI0019DB89D3|nr:DUF1127 domain-containing protein [Shimia sp.]MBE1292425.1 DUF1127 domain-containing protein [Paracoccaceae bacterium]MBO6897435.1 DUF1127 domain-containing protein [Shimia sp.]MEC8196234.1 DUF1127 domain-containing protein [Pseudomonadota bacterium]
MTMTTTNLQILTNHNANAQLPVAARAALSFAAVVTEWDKRTRTRRALARLSKTQLEDVGLSLHDARTEARKKMWQI